MAKKNKDARVQVILECTEQKTSGVPGMSRYVTTKNKKNTPERLELKKYNPFLKKVTVVLLRLSVWSVHRRPTPTSSRRRLSPLTMFRNI